MWRGYKHSIVCQIVSGLLEIIIIFLALTAITAIIFDTSSQKRNRPLRASARCGNCEPAADEGWGCGRGWERARGERAGSAPCAGSHQPTCGNAFAIWIWNASTCFFFLWQPERFSTKFLTHITNGTSLSRNHRCTIVKTKSSAKSVITPF